MQNKASAQWEGTLKEGRGQISTASGALTNAPYTFATRFGGQRGLNPEELIGAAHSACFSMAVSGALTEAGITAKKISTQATVTLEKTGPGFEIIASHLDVIIEAPGADRRKIEQAAETAKANCPVSKVLKAKVTMTAMVQT